LGRVASKADKKGKKGEVPFEAGKLQRNLQERGNYHEKEKETGLALG